MADNNILEVILRVVTQNTDAIGQLRQQLNEVGTSARTTSSHMGALGSEISTFESVLNRSILRFISWDLVIRGVQEGFRRLDEVVRSSIGAVDEMHNQAVALAGILTDLSRVKGPETWGQNFAYATQELDRLREKAAEVGVTWRTMEMVSRSFADVGIAPQNDAQLEAMVNIAKQAQFIAVTYREQIGSVMQIKELINGQVSSTNQLATVLRTNLGLTEQQFKQWVAIEARDPGKFLLDINRYLGITKEQSDEVSRSLKVQGELFQDNVNYVQRMAAAGGWAQVTSAVSELNHWIRQNATDLATALKPGFDQVGVAAQRFMAFLTDHKQEVLDALAAIANTIGTIATAIEGAFEAAVKFENALHRGAQGQEDAFLGTNVAGAMRAGQDLSTAQGRWSAAGVDPTNPLTWPGHVDWTVPPRPAGGVADTSKFGMGFSAPGGGFPQHAQTRAVDLSGGRGGGGSAFETAQSNIERQAAHERAMAEAIDDRAQREARIAQILREESAAFADLARHADTAAHAAEARRRAEELGVQAAVARRQAAQEAIAEQVQTSREFITNQQALGQMSTQGAIDAHERVLARLQGQAAAGGPGASQAAKDAEQEEVTLRQLHQKAFEERIQDSETFIAREVEIHGIGIAEQIADWQRLLTWIQTQHGPGVEAAVRQTMDRIVQLNRQAVDQQLADDKRRFDQQRDALTMQSQLAGLASQAARLTAGLPLGPQIAAGPGGLPGPRGGQV
ncbi:MAG TPA: hypothetical protein VJT33_07935, partial [bacterium]|nr:hypothetical protein [bacterium]